MFYYSKTVELSIEEGKEERKNLSKQRWHRTQFQFGAKRGRGKTTNQIFFEVLTDYGLTKFPFRKIHLENSIKKFRIV